MICPGCRLWVASGASACGVCGAAVAAADTHGSFSLVLPDERRVALTGCVTVGRSEDCTVWIDEPSVSRVHVRIFAAIDPPLLEDVGSRNGTLVNGQFVQTAAVSLTDGAVLHLGDAELRIERVRTDDDPWPGATITAPPSVTSDHLRLRQGVTIRRVDSGQRLAYTVRAPQGKEMVRVDGADVELLERIDGRHGVADLVRDARRTRGTWGVGRLIELIAVLAERGMIEGATPAEAARPRRLARLIAPRHWLVPGAPSAIATIYRRGGFLALTRLGLVLLVALAVGGMAAFVALIAQHGATPLLAASQLAYGVPAFVLGRLLGVVMHETAHGLVLTSFGHRVPRAGVTFTAGIPFAFVDTSPVWLESRHRRLAVSAAGPVSDLVLGGLLAVIGLALAPGLGSDLAFQLALAAYLGAVVNLNPMLDRDGHHLLEDLVGEPELRRRARARIAAIVGGTPSAGDSPRVLVVYGVAALVWTVAVAGIVVMLGIATVPRLDGVVPSGLVGVGVLAIAALVLAPLVQQVVVPLSRRARSGRRDDI